MVAFFSRSRATNRSLSLASGSSRILRSWARCSGRRKWAMSCIASAVSVGDRARLDLEERAGRRLERRHALGGDEPVRRGVGTERQQLGVRGVECAGCRVGHGPDGNAARALPPHVATGAVVAWRAMGWQRGPRPRAAAAARPVLERRVRAAAADRSATRGDAPGAGRGRRPRPPPRVVASAVPAVVGRAGLRPGHPAGVQRRAVVVRGHPARRRVQRAADGGHRSRRGRRDRPRRDVDDRPPSSSSSVVVEPSTTAPRHRPMPTSSSTSRPTSSSPTGSVPGSRRRRAATTTASQPSTGATSCSAAATPRWP